MAGTSIDEVIGACQTLYGPTATPEERKKANEFLTKWQCTEGAWEAALQVLSKCEPSDTNKNSVSVAFFAASSLRNKTSLDVNDLNTKEKMEFLKNSLFQQMLRFQNQQEYSTVLHQLCLALCGLAIHMDSLWPNLVQSLINELGNDVKNYAMLLDLLRFLPEENSNKRLLTDTKKRENNREELKRSMPAVFQFLQQINMPTPAAQTKVLQCFASWLKFSENVAQFFTPGSLLLPCFGYLDSSIDELAEVSCDVIVESVGALYPNDMISSPTTITLLDAAAKLQPKFYEYLGQKDASENLLRRYVRVFTAIGECLTNVAAVAMHENQQVQTLLEVLVKIMAIESAGLARMQIWAWIYLAEACYQAGTHHLESTQKVFGSVLMAMAETCKIPADIEDPYESPDEDFDKMRDELNQVLQALIDNRVLNRTTAFEQLIGRLQSLPSMGLAENDLVRSQEAVLFLLSGMGARSEPDDLAKSNHPGVPQSPASVQQAQALVDKTYLVLENLPTLIEREPNPAANKCWQDYCGESALWCYQLMPRWVLARDTALERTLDCICKLLMNGSRRRQLHVTASNTFRKICMESSSIERCPTTHLVISETSPLIKYLDKLLFVYETTLPTLGVRAHINLTDGVAYILSLVSDFEQFQRGLEKMIVPLMNAMKHAQATPVQLGEIMDRQVAILMNLQFNQRYVENVVTAKEKFKDCIALAYSGHIFPIVNQLSLPHCAEEHLVEKITRLQKHALRNYPKTFKTLLPAYMEMIALCFERKPLSSWLYAAEYSGQEYGQDPDLIVPIKTLFERLSKAAYQTLREQAAKPDGMNVELLEDFYGMYGRYTKCVPQIVFQSECLELTLKMVPEALAVQYKEAVEACMGFVESFLNSNDEACRHLLDQHGQNIVAGCFRVIARVPPDHVARVFPSFLCELSEASDRTYESKEYWTRWCSIALENEVPWRQIASPEEVKNWISLCSEVGSIHRALKEIVFRCEQLKKRQAA